MLYYLGRRKAALMGLSANVRKTVYALSFRAKKAALMGLSAKVRKTMYASSFSAKKSSTDGSIS